MLIKVCPMPIQNNIHCWWIEIKKSPKYKLNDNIGDLSKTTFWYHSNDTKRNPWVMLCSHCPINDSSGCLHIIVYLAVMLQASWHTAKVTKSQKFHISSHDVLQKSHTSEEGGAHHRISFLHLLMSFENQKNQNFEKMKKKKCWRYYYFTYVYQKLQSGTVPEIQSDTFFFCQLRPFFVLYPPPLPSP